MNLGAFSMSLNVADIAASRSFYEALGFAIVAGDQSQNWLVMKQGTSLIGLFQGMIGANTLTFNPGWTTDGAEYDPFDDIRDIQARLEAAGLTLDSRVDTDSSGRAHLTLRDPDGNAILIDQHR